jgi:hypothetical protein
MQMLSVIAYKGQKKIYQYKCLGRNGGGVAGLGQTPPRKAISVQLGTFAGIYTEFSYQEIHLLRETRAHQTLIPSLDPVYMDTEIMQFKI